MGSKRYIHYGVKRVIICIVVGALLSVTKYICVHAQNTVYIIEIGEDTYNYQELLNRYEAYSTAYSRNSITNQIESLTGTIAEENYDSLNNQYAIILQKIADLNMAREELIAYRDYLLLAHEEKNSNNSALLQEIDNQVTTIDAQLAQYYSSKSSAQVSVADAKLQEDVSAFYNTYQEALIKETQNLLKNEFLKRCFRLMISKEQINYCSTYQNYLGIAYRIETIKYKIGISNQSAIDKVGVDILKNETSMLKYQNSYDASRSSIYTDANISEKATIRLDMVLDKKGYDVNQTINRFIANNTNYLQLQNLENSYRNYKGSTGATSYAANQQVELKIKDYQLQIKELKCNIESYAKEAILSYQNAFKAMELAKKELLASEQKCNIVIVKMNHKKATTLELQQAYAEKKSAEIAYYQCCYEIVVWENILENGIYGATP